MVRVVLCYSTKSGMVNSIDVERGTWNVERGTWKAYIRSCSVPVDFPAVPHPHDDNQQNSIFNQVKDAVFSNPYPVAVIHP